MKKTLLLAISFLGLTLFTACNKDDENTGTDTNIVGTWTVSEADIDMTINEMPFLDYLIEELELDEEIAEFYATLFESIYSEFATDGLEITFKNDKTYTATMPDEDPESGTYSISADGKTMTLEAGTPDEIQIQIVSLSNSKIELKMEDEGEEDFNEDGEDETINVIVEMTLTK